MSYPRCTWGFLSLKGSLEEALGQPVWMVRYNADHPDMQKFNRLQTCRKCQFLDVVMELHNLSDNRMVQKEK